MASTSAAATGRRRQQRCSFRPRRGMIPQQTPPESDHQAPATPPTPPSPPPSFPSVAPSPASPSSTILHPEPSDSSPPVPPENVASSSGTVPPSPMPSDESEHGSNDNAAALASACLLVDNRPLHSRSSPTSPPSPTSPNPPAVPPHLLPLSPDESLKELLPPAKSTGANESRIELENFVCLSPDLAPPSTP